MKPAGVLFFLFIISSLFAHGQKVVIDKVESDSSRFVATEYMGGFSLWCNVESCDTTWMLSFYLGEKREIDVGRKLLIKLSDDQIITLENVREIGPFDYDAKYWSGTMHYVVYPLYHVEKEDLLSIIRKGIIKIRVESNLDTHDYDKKVCEKTTKFLIEEYQNILALLQVKKDLYSDF